MAEQYWIPKRLESEALNSLASLPAVRRLERKEIPDLIASSLEDLIQEAREQGMEVEALASSQLPDLRSPSYLTGEELLQTEQGQMFLDLLDWSQTELRPLNPEEENWMSELSLLPVLEALSMLS